jgi:hypothetical protein
MNGAGRSRWYLGWIPIHTVTMTSPIIRGHLRNRGKRTSTFSSPHSISGSRVCESIFKSCLLIQMTRLSDGINFTQSINLFMYTGVLTFFVGTHEHFAWICLGPWCSRTTVQTRCRQFICHSLMTCSTYPRRAMTGGRQYSLVCTSTSLGHVSNRPIA